MRHSSANNSIPAGNPIANALVVIAGVLAIAASVVLGFFAFIALSAVILVAASVIGLRVWWLKRTYRAANGKPTDGVIEGEYQVISKEQDEA